MKEEAFLSFNEYMAHGLDKSVIRYYKAGFWEDTLL